MKIITDTDLFRIIDGDLSSKEEEKLMTIIESDHELTSRLAYLRSLSENLREIELDFPSPEFGERVMENLHSIKYKIVSKSIFDSKKWITLATILGGVFVGIYILALGFVDIELFSGISTEAIPVPPKTINLKPIMDMFTASLFFKIFLFIDLILGILILDKAVLKPYFNRRQKSYS